MSGASTAALPSSAPPEDRTDFSRILFEGVNHVVWSGTVGGDGLSVSGNVARLCAGTPAAFLANPSSVWVDRAHPADKGRVDDAYRSLLVTGAPFDEEYRWIREDGSTIWLHGRAVLRPGAGTPIVDGLFVDVTEQRRLADEVCHLQKVEVIGEFTGGIAHDFNNLLAVILANATLLLDALEAGDPRRADAVAVLEAGERAAALTRQLLPFTRKHIFEPRSLDLNEVVCGVEPLLRRVIGEDVEFVIRLADGLPSVRADARLLEQVVMNLAINARDAMPGGGTLSIETSARTDGSVRLSVSDTGHGMDAATRLRVFEPFFTTKAKGKGTGLGLAASRTIVQQCGGSIRVESAPGTGSIFEVVLPALDAIPTAAVDAAQETWREFPGTEQILLVEDDDGVRALVRRMLMAMGYDVTCARDAQEAVAAVQSQSRPFELLLTDVIMRPPNGAEVAELVAKRSPSTRALLMSGHSMEMLVERGILNGNHSFIHKPFTPAGLARRVREVLDA